MSSRKGQILLILLAVALVGVICGRQWATDNNAEKDMRDDIVAMQFQPDPEPRAIMIGRPLSNPRVETQAGTQVVHMNVLIKGCSVVLQRLFEGAGFNIVGGREIEVYRVVAVLHDYTQIDLLKYAHQMGNHTPDDVAAFLKVAISQGAKLPCYKE